MSRFDELAAAIADGYEHIDIAGTIVFPHQIVVRRVSGGAPRTLKLSSDCGCGVLAARGDDGDDGAPPGNGGGATRFFLVRDTAFELRGLTLRGGATRSAKGGGAVEQTRGSFVATDCAFVNNSAPSGGAVALSNTLGMVHACRFEGNAALAPPADREGDDGGGGGDGGAPSSPSSSSSAGGSADDDDAFDNAETDWGLGGALISRTARCGGEACARGRGRHSLGNESTAAHRAGGGRGSR